MRTWCTKEPVLRTARSQISHAVIDSAREAHSANVLDGQPSVKDDRTLVLEIKGEDDEQNRIELAAMDKRVAAVNLQGGFGEWQHEVVFEVTRLQDVIDQRTPACAGA